MRHYKYRLTVTINSPHQHGSNDQNEVVTIIGNRYIKAPHKLKHVIE